MTIGSCLFSVTCSLLRTRPAWPTASVPAPNAPRVAYGLSPCSLKPRYLYLTSRRIAIMYKVLPTPDSRLPTP
ncbi:MAG: hypothetical protein F6K55_48270 [Moorea sp. SIO4A3]|nr:hypothetical protein [Moorena sp. SIO4A3]